MTAACIHCGNLGPNDDAGEGVDAEALIDLAGEASGYTSDALLKGIRALAASRDAAVRRLDALTLPGAERRERIATACLAGMLAGEPYDGDVDYALVALTETDALIAALDGTVKP